MNRTATFAVSGLATVMIVGGIFYYWLARSQEDEHSHYERRETELIVSNPSQIHMALFRAGRSLEDTLRLGTFDESRIWLTPGNYFLTSFDEADRLLFPVPLVGFRGGPDKDGSFVVAVRPRPRASPPCQFSDMPDFRYIPSGSFLLGDRQNPREPHYVWLTAYFIAPFELSNREFGEFVDAPDGYANDLNWTTEGRRWKLTSSSHSAALLTPAHPDYVRFGKPDLPVTRVTWFEANAFCKWLTKRIGNGRWLYALPTDAEWEKAARGPDSFDFALGMALSDNEVRLYNWKKNPDAPVTVIGMNDSPSLHRPNRYGLYHMTGNVVEWTQSINRPYSTRQQYVEDERNHDDVPGQRVARGGSWYSASIAYLYTPYRDAFQPEHSSHDIGFRIVARPLP
jgi:formylglycine-generating enzyme required for sulfatase activity